MLITENLFRIFLIIHLSKGLTDTGTKKEMKNYIGNSAVNMITKKAQPYLSKNQDLYNDESSDVTDGSKQQDDSSAIEKNKIKKIKDYHNNNFNSNAINNNNNNNLNNPNANRNNHQYYRKNSFQIRKCIKHDNANNNSTSNYDKYAKESNIGGNKELAAKTNANDKFSSNHNNENTQPKTMDKNYINAYNNKVSSGNKKMSNNKNDLFRNVYQSDSLNHFNNDKNKSKSQHKGSGSRIDDLYNPFLSHKPLAHEFSFFVNKIFRLNPLLMSSEFDKSNTHRNYSELHKFISEDKIQQLKNEIGERIKHHNPVYTGDVKELDHLESKLNNPVLQEDSLIDNVISVQNFISDVMKNAPGNLLRNNFNSDVVVNERDPIKNHSSFKLSPLRFNNYFFNDNLFTRNLKNESENYTESKNNVDTDESNYSLNNFDSKRLSSYLTSNKELSDKNENLKQINNVFDSDELDNNNNTLNSNFYSKNQNILPSYLSRLSNDHLDKIRRNDMINKANDLSQINQNDDYYYRGISNSFDGQHLNLVPTSILIKSLNKRDMSMPAPNPVWYSRDFDENNNNNNRYKYQHGKFNHKNKKGQKIRVKSTVKTPVETVLLNKYGDETDVDKICQTYSPKKHKATTINDECNENNTGETMCESSTTSCEPTAMTFENTTSACEPSTSFETTITCEPPVEQTTTTCEPTNISESTTTCEPSTANFETTTYEPPIDQTTTTCEPSNDPRTAVSETETEEDEPCENSKCDVPSTSCQTSAEETASSTCEPTATTACKPEETTNREETTVCSCAPNKQKTRKKLRTTCECVTTTCETRCEIVAESDSDECDYKTTLKSKITESEIAEESKDSNNQNLMIEN